MRKKKLFGILAVLLLFLGDYLYWTVPVSLTKKMPEGDWLGAQLWWYDEYFDSHEINVDRQMLQELAEQIEMEEVSNRYEFQTISQPYFLLYLYYDEGYPCLLEILENGDIALVPELDTDKRKYFDGGEELYQILLALTET